LKLRTLKAFFDLKTNELFEKAGIEFERDEERAKELIEKGIAEVVKAKEAEPIKKKKK
jgi:hypothetical protein